MIIAYSSDPSRVSCGGCGIRTAGNCGFRIKAEVRSGRSWRGVVAVVAACVVAVAAFFMTYAVSGGPSDVSGSLTEVTRDIDPEPYL